MSYKCRLTSRCVQPLFLLLRTCVFVCVCVDAFQEQKFAMEPQDQTAVVGSRVTLPCRVEKKAGQLQWTKDDFGLGLHRELSGYDRYKMIGSDEEGDYSLDIRDVTLDDDAKYQCQVSSGARGEPPIRSRYARLTVLVPPEPPKILQGSFYSTTEDRIIKLECVSVGGKPPAEITWVDSNAGVLTQGVTYTVEPLSDGQRFTARSIIKMTPKQEHHNQTFTCQAQNTADRAYRAASIQIEVKYAPKVKIHVKAGRRVPEGSDVVIECTAEANPNNLTYKWVMNDSVVGNSSVLRIPNVSRDFNGVVIKCMVFNEVGKSEETETMEVTYPPSFRNRPKDVEAEVGKQVTLSCDVDGFPAPEIRWLHYEEDTNIRVGRTSNLTLTVDTHTSGRYLCKASVEGYKEIEAEASIFIKGPPKILSNNTQFGSQGDAVHIECAAFSVPKIDNIVWTFEGKEIDTLHDQDYAFLEDLQPGGIVNSTLIIRDSQSRHFGVYKCNVSNDFGSDTLEIVLQPNKSFPLLLILFGVTSGTIMVAAVIMLVILCQRKQRKNKQQVTEKPDVTVTTEDLYKENDRNSNISDLKLELRQANGSCEIDYSNTGSDSTLCSNAKLGSGIPLAGTVPLTTINQGNTYQPYRYSNDYTDPAYADCYKVNGISNGYHTYVHYGHDYTPGSLRVRSPTLGSEKLTPNRSINGSLPRSIDTPSSAQYNANGSQNNSLQRSTKRLDSSGTLSNIAQNGEGSRAPNGILPGVDVRYAATYGNPHLRALAVHTAVPAATPAPPPYSALRNSVIMPSGTSSHSITSPTSGASPHATSPVTNSTLSNDSAQPASVTPQSPGAHYILANNRAITNTVTKKGNSNLQPLATHV
ncbi:irregular chiasm C-roughest protein-like isoform X2 [Aricia agestis]|uniref:irregular chiasm C-roughest protein-like isoform X2 n=1 Tax=Aricia agestis TaxID=91739 RepID=UPI001C201612|nr:irregular chiasm C-roughest protein-like isoform X2 [Aricia agestis]